MLSELLELTRENNKMLRQIVKYLNMHTAQSDKENQNDFIMNVIANLISNKFNK